MSRQYWGYQHLIPININSLAYVDDMLNNKQNIQCNNMQILNNMLNDHELQINKNAKISAIARKQLKVNIQLDHGPPE